MIQKAKTKKNTITELQMELQSLLASVTLGTQSNDQRK